MNKTFQILLPNFINIRISDQPKKFRFILVLLLGTLSLPLQQIRSDEIFLKCTGMYELNRGALIKPDWETSYFKINLNGLFSTIDDKGIKKVGRTSIRRNSYTITHRDNRRRVKDIYKINGTHGTYTVKSPQMDRTLIGTCQKSRG
tara:strand:+ start:289 stop:726 length:438 start_codon:yes stop_codon:yes gene_type:complete